MSAIKKFEDYVIWKEARILCQEIYTVTEREPFCKDWSLKDQIRRSGGSVMDNIAEGHERGGNKEFAQFLGFARGSGGEVKSQLYRAFDQQYISEEEFQRMYGRAKRICSGITNLIAHLKRSDNRGFKYH